MHRIRQVIAILPSYAVSCGVGGLVGLIFITIYGAIVDGSGRELMHVLTSPTLLRDWWGATQLTAAYSIAPFVVAIAALKFTRQIRWLVYALAGGAVAFVAVLILDMSMISLAIPLVPAGFVAGLAYRATELLLLAVKLPGRADLGK